MSEAVEMLRSYKEIRDRLRRPPNAVKDAGINLHLKRIPLTEEQSRNIEDFQEVLEEVIAPLMGCRVGIYEVPQLQTMGRVVGLSEIMKVVCGYFLTTPKVIKGGSRKGRDCLARHIVFYLARKHTKLSFPRIGRRLRRDHTTVISGYSKLVELLLVDEALADAVRSMEAILATGIYDNANNIPRSTVAPDPESHLAQGTWSSLP